jgi:hypothetical protein
VRNLDRSGKPFAGGRIGVNNEQQWTPRRAYDLRLDAVAKAAAEAVKACGSHTDAAERFLRRFIDHLDSAEASSDPNGPPRAA